MKISPVFVLFMMCEIISLSGFRIKAIKRKTSDKCGNERSSGTFSNSFSRNFARNWRAASAIVGGQEAISHSQPWNVYLKIYFKHKKDSLGCSGVLISDRWVISAANCLEGNDHVYVTIAAHDLTKEKSERHIVYRVDRDSVFLHEDFDRPTMKADIALLRLPFQVPHDLLHVKYAGLPTSNQNTASGDTCISSGWGVYQVNPYLKATKLLTINVTIYPCPYDFTIPMHLCAGTPRGVMKAQGICDGDSGGPLICNVGGAMIAVGILSAGTANCINDVSSPALYTRITSYLDWIRAYTNVLPLWQYDNDIE